MEQELKDGKIETDCYCLNCKEETRHILNYVGGYLKSGKCKSCGKEFRNKKILLQAYLKGLAERIIGKQENTLIEIENKGIKKFLSELPHRLSEKSKEELINLYNLIK